MAEYKPLFPEIVAKGCEGGFCKPPTSAFEEISTIINGRISNIINTSQLTQQLIEEVYNVMKDVDERVDNNILNRETIDMFVDKELEACFLELQYNCLVVAYNRFYNEREGDDE